MRTASRAAAGVLVLASVSAACVATRPPAVTGPPRYPEYPTPEIPASVRIDNGNRQRHLAAWQRLQSGDLHGARLGFDDVLRRVPSLYPAMTGLGFVELAAEQPDEALARFDAALAAADVYLPAWLGRAEALLELGRDADAVVAMERILGLDPERDRIRSRLELIRFRAVQQLIGEGQQARAAGRLDDAREALDRARDLSPSSTIILHELAGVEREAGRLAEAERLARQAVELEPREARWQADVGDVLEAQGRFAEAAEAYDRALSIEPRPAWRVRADELRARAELAALPGNLDELSAVPSLTRAEVAAVLGIRLSGLVRDAPVRVTEIATDVRTHWAAPWILPVTRAGVMTIYANHTFQPDDLVSRGDLAVIVSELVRLAVRDRAAMLEAWEAAEPRFADVPATNVRYGAVALAVSAGAMSAGPGGAFRLAESATGADLVAAVQRIDDITLR